LRILSEQAEQIPEELLGKFCGVVNFFFGEKIAEKSVVQENIGINQKNLENPDDSLKQSTENFRFSKNSDFFLKILWKIPVFDVGGLGEIDTDNEEEREEEEKNRERKEKKHQYFDRNHFGWKKSEKENDFKKKN